MLARIGAIEDSFDAIVDTGLISGADGFDDRAWELDAPREIAGARTVKAHGRFTFIARVQRQWNRIAAP